MVDFLFKKIISSISEKGNDAFRFEGIKIFILIFFMLQWDYRFLI